MSALEGFRSTASPASVAGVASADPDGQQKGERRLLTALCYDLVGSTELLESMDIEDYQDLLAAFQADARKAIESNSGTIRADTGDGGLVLFPMQLDPRDAASFAISAGFDIISACRRVGSATGQPNLAVRVGVATSYFLLSDGNPATSTGRVTGAALALATRLQSLAQPNTVLVADDARQLVGRSFDFSSAGTQQLKGFATPQQIWRAMRRRRQADRFFAFGRVTSPFVGRLAEMRRLGQCWTQACAGEGQTVEISGEAGLGKSRILHEVRKLTRAKRTRLLLFQCLPGGARSALHPILFAIQKSAQAEGARLTLPQVQDFFREHGVTDAKVVGTFSFLLGVEGADNELADADLQTVRSQSAWAAQRAIQQMCADGPVVLVVEDVQWADLTTRQLLIEVARVAGQHKLLLIVTARHEGTIAWPVAVQQLALQPLDGEAARSAIAAALGASHAQASPAATKLIAQLAGGVPLFIEEICRLSADTGQDLSQLSARKATAKSTTFERIVEARLQQLGEAADVVRAAAVAVHRFGADLLLHLVPEQPRAQIAAMLEKLVQAGFLNQIRLTEPPLYMFRHALIQETVYQSLLRGPKRTLHGRFFNAVREQPALAPWLGTATLAEHAERGGLLDEAITHYTRAGQEHAGRSAVAEARQLLDHALVLCEQVHRPDEQDTLRLAAMSVLGPVLTGSEGPRSAPARQLYDEGVALARRRPMTERARWFPIYWGWWFTGTDVNGERAHAVLRELKDVQDSEVQLQTRHCVWAIDFYLGKHSNCITSVDEALPLYEPMADSKQHTRFGGHDAKVCGLAHRGLSLWFRGQVNAAIASVADARALALEQGHVGSIAHALQNCAILSCYRRDFATLQADIAAIRELTEKNALPTMAATTQIYDGWCESVAGDAARGFVEIEVGLSRHSELQTPEDYPVYCCMLAEAAARCDKAQEALQHLEQALATAEESGHLYWLAEVYRWQARLLLLQGKVDDAVAAFKRCLATAAGQGALPLLQAGLTDLQDSGLAPELVQDYAQHVAQAEAARPRHDAPVYVAPPPRLAWVGG